jgi:hypothetical protein
MKIAFDFDGVITSNFTFYNQLMYHFIHSGHEVYIITGAKFERAQGIELILTNLYTKFIHRPKDFVSTPFTIGTWKKIQLIKYDIDLWFENEVKQYEQAGVDFSDIKTAIVRI